MDRLAPELDELAGDQVVRTVSADYRIMHRAGLLDWAHKDPFDRIIAAAALERDLTLVTKDAAFAGVRGLRTLW